MCVCVCVYRGGASLVQTNGTLPKTYHLHHLWVVKVVDDVLQNVSVGHEAQRSEDDDDGDFLSDVGQRGDDPLPNGTLLHPLRKNQRVSGTAFPKAILATDGQLHSPGLLWPSC